MACSQVLNGLAAYFAIAVQVAYPNEIVLGKQA